MKLAFLLLVLAPPRDAEIKRGVILDYAGKYRDDPRLAVVLARLPDLRAEALKRIGAVLGETVSDTFLVRLADAGADRSGRWAEVRTERVAGKVRPVLILRTEHLVLDTHDLQKTLTHELYHCVQRERLGETRHLATPEWAREGAALYVAGQAEDRARALAAYVGTDTRVSDPLARLVNGLGGRHTLEDYAEDVSAFLSVEARHGRGKTVALLRALLSGEDRAIERTLGETPEVFERHAAAHARQLLEPLIENGRASIRTAQQKLATNDFEAALTALKPEGVYAASARYFRALALFRLGRYAPALKALGDPAIRRTTRVSDAVLLELRILKATGDVRFAAAARRARLDLEPFRVYPALLALLKDER